MIERSNEIIKQLNRLANDRRLAPHTRNRMRDAAQHIRDLHLRLKELMRDRDIEIDLDNTEWE